MAVSRDASTDTIRRTTNLPAAQSFTMMGWFKISTDRNDYSGFLTFGSSGTNTGDFYVGTTTDGTTLISYNHAADGPSGTNLTVGTWYHVALVRNGTGAGNLIVYLNGVQDTVHSAGSAGADSATGIAVGGRTADANDWLNGSAAAIKIYDAVLTASEVAQEVRQITPARMANLNAFYPFWGSGDMGDYSGNGRSWTTGGTFGTDDGPPVPWKACRPRRVYVPSATVSNTAAVWLLGV